MNKQNTQSLLNKYPKIFRQHTLPMDKTAMCWLFECGNGWYNIIDELCSRLQEDIDLNGKPQTEAVQVKEKYGGLCFYIDSGDDIVDIMIREAEKMSEETCEVCGDSGAENRETNGWYRTRCNKCKDIK